MQIEYNKKICIYGLGKYGLQTYFRLKENSISVDFFADRDIRKHGYVLDNVFCKSIDEILKMSHSMVLIIAIEKPNETINFFKHEGFNTVLTKDEALDIFGCNNLNPCGYQIDNIDQIIYLHEEIVNAVYNDSESNNPWIAYIISQYRIRNRYHENS